jgi:microcystin-dependent protein
VSEPFIGEIRAVGYNFAPVGWALCNGQLLPISQNTALFSLLGTFYGGNGTTNFQLPDLRGASPLHAGQGTGLSMIPLGASGGVPAVKLQVPQIPEHSHAIGVVDAGGTQTSPAGAAFAEARTGRVASLQYGAGVTPTTMNPKTLNETGGSSPHNNMPPFLVVNFIIALTGIFPARS